MQLLSQTFSPLELGMHAMHGTQGVHLSEGTQSCSSIHPTIHPLLYSARDNKAARVEAPQRPQQASLELWGHISP